MEEELKTGLDLNRDLRPEENREADLLKSRQNPDREDRPDLAQVVASCLSLPKKDWMQYSPLSLAWIGDTVYDLIVRSVLLHKGMTQTDKLHRKASGIVNARAQAALMNRIRDALTEEERSVYKRGCNAKPPHTAKNANRKEYLEATGFECLVGYLYLTGRYERLLELIGQEMCI